MKRTTRIPQYIQNRFGGCIAFLLLFMMPNLNWGQASDLTMAYDLMASRNYVRSQILFDRMLSEQPGNLEARLGRAILFSWQKEYKQANHDFEQILDQDPYHLPTLTAYGYNLAWQGNYVHAESMFRKVLVKDPNHRDAVKGLAYMALWKGKGKLAINRFQRLLKDPNAQDDIHVGLGHAYLLAGRQKAARESFTMANRLNDQHPGTRELLDAVQAAPAFVELSAWGGYTDFQSQSTWGLRAAEIALQPNNFYRVWMRYDNTLSLENFALVQRRLQSEGYFAGSLFNWNKILSSKVEVGIRDVPEAPYETMLTVEQLVFLRNNMILKAGGFFNDPTGEITWTAFGGVSLLIRDGFSIEPMYFFTRPGATLSKEQRWVLNSYVRLGKGHQVNTSAFYGRIVPEEGAFQDLFGGSAAWMIPVFQKHWMQLLVRYETGIQELFTASLGVKYRIER